MNETNTAPNVKKEASDSDQKIMAKIRRILEKGNNAEVKKRSDGSIVVLDVKKNVV